MYAVPTTNLSWDKFFVRQAMNTSTILSFLLFTAMCIEVSLGQYYGQHPTHGLDGTNYGYPGSTRVYGVSYGYGPSYGQHTYGTPGYDMPGNGINAGYWRPRHGYNFNPYGQYAQSGIHGSNLGYYGNMPNAGTSTGYYDNWPSRTVTYSHPYGSPSYRAGIYGALPAGSFG